MYKDFYGFRERPFKLLPDPGYLFLSRQHRLALLHLEYGLLNNAGFVVVTGEIGTGKTTLIKVLLQRLDQDTVAASVFNTTVGPEEFLALILQEFELEPTGPGLAEKIDRLNAFLISCFAQGQRVILIVDEAQNLCLETLEEIRLLSNLQTDKDYLIQIILVGQPGLRDKLSHPGLRQLAQRISVHYHLHSLNAEETAAYICHRLEVSGGKEARDIFSSDAMDAIYQYSSGTPRLINLLCDACLVNGFADQVRTVTASMVEDVAKGEDASSFWEFAAASTADLQDTHQVTGDDRQLTADNGRLEALEKQVSELQSAIVILSRLVHENLLSQEDRPQKETGEIEGQILASLKEKQAKVRQLTTERDELLKKFSRLSVRTSGGNRKEETPLKHDVSLWCRLWPWG